MGKFVLAYNEDEIKESLLPSHFLTYYHETSAGWYDLLYQFSDINQDTSLLGKNFVISEYTETTPDETIHCSAIFLIVDTHDYIEKNKDIFKSLNLTPLRFKDNFGNKDTLSTLLIARNQKQLTYLFTLSSLVEDNEIHWWWINGVQQQMCHDSFCSSTKNPYINQY